MPISRLRLQLSAWFALVFVFGLGAADVALFAWLRRQSETAFTRNLVARAQEMSRSVRRELRRGHESVPDAASEAFKEWPEDENGFAVFDSVGNLVATHGPDSLSRLIPPHEQLPAANRTWDIPLDPEGDLRLSLARGWGVPAFTVVAFQPTANLRESSENLALWLALSLPMVVLLSLAGGYVLARRALRPLRDMTEEIQAIDAQDLQRRLPVRRPPDELDALAEQFNRLFERLASAQARSRRFLAEAAHQIRTPLTVIRGESSLGLERERSSAEHLALLRRVSRAAEQMTHRVDSLFLLAQAESGDRPALTDQVDVDGLVLDCVDLMRGRADMLGHQLALEVMDAAEVTGNESLLREAVLELLENALRHGASSQPIRVATRNGGAQVRVEVSSGGAPVAGSATPDETEGRTPLGLSIVRWIATTHGGALVYRHEAGSNVFVLELAAARHERG